MRKATRSSKVKGSSSKGGRPSAYRAEYAHIAYRHTLLGAIDKDLAEAFSVSEQTINSWKKSHPKFRESIQRGKSSADAIVAESLFKRANGYSHPAVKIFSCEGVTTEHAYTEHYPPDTAACIFFLKNRQPDKWRDKPEVQVDVHTDVRVDLSKPMEEWGEAELRAELARRGALPGKPK